MPALDSGCSRYPAIFLQSAEVGVSKNDSKSVAYEFRTKSAQSGGLETNGRRERISGLSRRGAVRRFSREARGYWRFYARQNPAEKVGRGRTGGGSGIRTHVTVSRKHAFQACAFSHSATPPNSSSAHAFLHQDARKARFCAFSHSATPPISSRRTPFYIKTRARRAFAPSATRPPLQSRHGARLLHRRRAQGAPFALILATARINSLRRIKPVPVRLRPRKARARRHYSQGRGRDNPLLVPSSPAI